MTPLSELVQAFVVALLQGRLNGLVEIVFVVLILPLIHGVETWVNTHVSAQQLAIVKSIINSVVLAAEQSGLKDGILRTGAEKRAWAIGEIQRILRERGLNVLADNTPLLASLLEGSVFQQLNQNGFALVEAQPIDLSGLPKPTPQD